MPARTRPEWPRELALFGAVYVVYAGGRWLVRGDERAAMDNATALLDLQRKLGVALEDEVQAALMGTDVMVVLDHVYMGAEFVVLPLVLGTLYRAARPAYRGLRSTLLWTWMLALPVFALLPMAPPRLSSAGLVDTVSVNGAFALDDRVTTQFYNPFAAMPSLHCGFALALGLTVASVTQDRSLRVAAALWPALVALATVATGNHYVLDVIAGFAMAGAGHLAAVRSSAWRRPRTLAPRRSERMSRWRSGRVRSDS